MDWSKEMGVRATVWKQGATVIPIGGGWAYAVGETESGNIRIAKGKLSGANTNAPISQGMKLNLKPKDSDQWEQIKVAVDALMYGTPPSRAHGETKGDDDDGVRDTSV